MPQDVSKTQIHKFSSVTLKKRQLSETVCAAMAELLCKKLICGLCL